MSKKTQTGYYKVKEFLQERRWIEWPRKKSGFMRNWLIEAREAAGITQEKLAEKVGLQSNSIHRYEAAERKMNFFTAVKVADALNTTVERLIPEEYIHKTEKTDIEREAEDVFHQLSPEDQKMLLRQMKGLLAVPA